MTSTAKESPRVATFKLDAGDYEQLSQIAREEDRTLSAILRIAVRQYLSGRTA